MQVELQFRNYNFRYKEEAQRRLIFDEVRKKYVALTPEEWVRQHLLHYLMYDRKYPRSLIAVEKSLEVNNLQKRTDIVIYNTDGKPVLLAECKAPECKITQDVFEQAGRYNLTLQVPYLLISNGRSTYCCHINFKDQQFIYLDNIPEYSDF